MSIYSLCLMIIAFFSFDSADVDQAVPHRWMTELNQTIAQREEAVNEKDWRLFAQTFHHQDSQYMHEQKRWFEDAIAFVDPHSYHLQIERIAPKGKRLAQVWIKQRFRHDRRWYHNRFPLLFYRTEEGWQDRDFFLYQVKKDRIRVLYTDPLLEEKAHVALDIVQRAQYVLADRFHWRPKQVTVKLYHRPEWFRQSVKLSLPKWAGGWNEAFQSIKLVADRRDVRSFASSLVHELVHQMISDRSGDNAAYWLQEGAAMYYEAHLLPGLHEEVPQQVTIRPDRLAALERTNLERLPDREAFRYYYSCYQLFHFLIETYGEEQIDTLLETLSKQPLIDRNSSQKIAALNRRTEQALQQVLGESVQSLDQKWAQFQKKKEQEREIELPTFES